MKAVLLAMAMALLAALPAAAHESLPASLTLTEVQPRVFEAELRVPAVDGRAPDIAPRFPAGCAIEQGPQERAAPGARVQRWRLRCASQLGQGERIAFDGLPATMINTLVQLELQDGRRWSRLAAPRAPQVQLGAADSARLDVAGYFALGVEHILSGIDHLLFVLCLILLVPQRWRLLQTITAFTLAHSVTLALAALGVVHVAQAPVEACIALSIVFLARELARPAAGSLAVRRPWLVAFGFGLLHGLGFAGALAEVGLPPNDIPLALLLFNLGVEAGQLAFVLAVSLLLAALRMRHGAPRLERAAAYGVGAVAAFWTLQRLAPIVA